MVDIAKAAAELDKFVGKLGWVTADWRQKIDLDTLDMYGAKKCILGQLQGHYDYARGDIRVIDSSFEFYAFTGWTSEWKEYLKGYEFQVGQEWKDKDGCCTITIKAVTKVDGETYVLYRRNGRSVLTESAASLVEDGYTLKPKFDFEVGDLLTFGEDKDNLYIFLDNKKVLRLNYKGGGNSQSDFDWYVTELGEPKKLSNAKSVLASIRDYI